jgi:hypothetical protein
MMPRDKIIEGVNMQWNLQNPLHINGVKIGLDNLFIPLARDRIDQLSNLCQDTGTMRRNNLLIGARGDPRILPDLYRVTSDHTPNTSMLKSLNSCNYTLPRKGGPSFWSSLQNITIRVVLCM